jgi:alkyl-hydroperoxide reductase/thiol specific antioxidant family protein
VNLRTFLPPRALAAAKAPKPGEPAPLLPRTGFTTGRPAVVAFLRHTGCPFAEATMHALREAAAETGDQLDWIALSHAPKAATKRWCDAVGGHRGVRMLLDPDRTTYADWGLRRTSLGHFMGRRSLTEVARLARRGIRNRHPEGTRWQQAGTFAVDSTGTVRWRHLPAHAGDLPDLEAAAAAALARP